MNVDLAALVARVETSAPRPLDRLGLATIESQRLIGLADDLVSYFVQACRDDRCSWSEIGERLGVSKQAAQKRYVEVVEESPVSSRGVKEHTGKYRPLWEWLCQQRGSRVDMTFAEIEEILGFALPPSSRTHPPHWHGYEGSAVARAIIDAGWRSRDLNMPGERVTFVRSSRA